ncbi:MAG: glycosyltransferase family 4 protein [Dehalococcoidia bacterium]|nr:glycosyltransferase family 4 protein [Dehalococcoidia bacterium]
MKICQVVLSKGWGGAETVVYELSRHLRDKGHSVSIVLNEEIVHYYDTLENVELFNIGPLYDPTALAKSIVAPKARSARECDPHNRALLLFYAYLQESLARVYWKRIRRQVRQFLSDKEFDVIHSHMSEGVLFVCSLGDLQTPTLTTPHGEHYLGGVVPVHPLMIPLAAWRKRKFKEALEKATAVTEVSASMLREYAERGINLEGKSVVISNGINIAEIQRGSSEKSEVKGEFTLLFPGGSKFVKGGDLLVTAMATLKGRIPNIHLYIALDVPKKHLLRKMVQQYGLEENVTFSGFLPIHDYRRLLNSVDVLVMPSRGEAFALACLEAMALGKPIVATKVGGIPDVVIQGRNGLLVNTNPDEIAQAILELHRNEDLRRRMESNNLQDVVVFDWSGIVDQYLQVERDLAESKD